MGWNQTLSLPHPSIPSSKQYPLRSRQAVADMEKRDVGEVYTHNLAPCLGRKDLPTRNQQRRREKVENPMYIDDRPLEQLSARPSFEFISLRTIAVFGPTPSHYRPRCITLNTIIFEILPAHHVYHLTNQRTYRVASSSMLVPFPGSSAFLLSAASISLRASSPISSGFSNRLEPSGAAVDGPACAMSLTACFRSRCTRKEISRPTSETPNVTPTPIPTFVLELRAEEAVFWVGCSTLAAELEGSAEESV